jgi:hypothetical protein
LRFECKCVEDLPKDLKKIVRASKMPDEFFEKDLQAMLNILHFMTKKVYVTGSSTTTTPGAASSTPKSPTDSPLSEHKAPTKDTPEKGDKVPKSEEKPTAEKKGVTIAEVQPVKEGKVSTPPTERKSEKTEKKSEKEKKLEKRGSNNSKTEITSIIDFESCIVRNKNPKDLFKSMKKHGKG